MSAPDHWQSLKPETRMEMEKHARQLVRGSIIEDAAARFMAMCMAEAIGESKRRADLAPAAPKVKALVWERHPRGFMASAGGIGDAYIFTVQKGGEYECIKGLRFAPRFRTSEAAKAAAQADYEARILAALEGGDA